MSDPFEVLNGPLSPYADPISVLYRPAKWRIALLQATSASRPCSG